METDSGPDRRDALTPAAARALLGDLDHDRATLANRIVTPWWYHPALGVITASFVTAHVLPGALPLTVTAIGICCLPVLTSAYARRYGVAISKPTGPRSRRLLIATLAVLAAAMASGLLMKVLEVDSWWALVPAAVTYVATVVLGRRFDAALRAEIATPSGGRS